MPEPTASCHYAGRFVVLRLILAAPWSALPAWVVGTLLIFSLARGTLSGSREACWFIDLALWCLGSANLDYLLDLARPNGWLGGMIHPQSQSWISK